MSIIDDIRSYAQMHGVDPAYALAVASRESSFNPAAHASKTIHGLFQVSGAERSRLGIPLTNDVHQQVAGFARLTNELHDDMAHRLGREPTPSEMYLGHYWGPGRAAGVINGRYSGLTARDVFTPRELAENPNLKPDKPVSQIAANIQADMGRRYAKYSGGSTPAASNVDEGQAVEDPWKYLTPQGGQDTPDPAGQTMDNPTTRMAMSAQSVADAGYKPEGVIVDQGTGAVAVDPAGPANSGIQKNTQGTPVLRQAWDYLTHKDEDPQPKKQEFPAGAPALNTQPPQTNTFTPAPVTPDAPTTTPPDDTARTQLALNDGDDKGLSLGDGLAGLASGIGQGMSAPKAPAAPKAPTDSDLLQQMILAQQMNQPVDGLPSMPGQKQQASAGLPGANQQAPSYLDPRMFGIQPNQ